MTVPPETALDGEVLVPAAPGRHCWSQAEEVARGEEIHTAHAEGERALKDAVKHFVRCGNLLLKAKAEIGHGQFSYFLQHQAKLHPRTAQRYMLLARSLPQLPAAKATRLSQLSLRDAMGELSRLSSRAAKLPHPALDDALADARRQPVKTALTRASTNQCHPTYAPVAIVSPAMAVPPRSAPERAPAESAATHAPQRIELVVKVLRRSVLACGEAMPDLTDEDALAALDALRRDIEWSGLARQVPADEAMEDLQPDSIFRQIAREVGP